MQTTKRVMGGRVGLLKDVVLRCEELFSQPKQQPQDKYHYIDWINTKLPENIYLEIAINRDQSWGTSVVYLTIQNEKENAVEFEKDTINFNKIATLFNETIVLGICSIVSD